PALPRETMQRVLDLIRKDVVEDKVHVDTPTQNLENYFLDVVHKARQAAAATSGAMSGARVAAYLRGESKESTAPDKILERLASPKTQVVAKTAPQQPEQVVNEQKLAALAKPTEQTATEAKPGAEPEKTADLEKANEKLSSLLNRPK